jgi:acrylyl-CoA reductase (NADPH)
VVINSFKALVVNQTNGDFSILVKNMTLEELPKGEVLINVAYSCVNYKARFSMFAKK